MLNNAPIYLSVSTDKISTLSNHPLHLSRRFRNNPGQPTIVKSIFVQQGNNRPSADTAKFCIWGRLRYRRMRHILIPIDHPRYLIVTYSPGNPYHGEKTPFDLPSIGRRCLNHPDNSWIATKQNTPALGRRLRGPNGKRRDVLPKPEKCSFVNFKRRQVQAFVDINNIYRREVRVHRQNSLRLLALVIL